MDGATRVLVHDTNECLALLYAGHQNRATASTRCVIPRISTYTHQFVPPLLLRCPRCSLTLRDCCLQDECHIQPQSRCPHAALREAATQ